jgi:hypothetical protein
LKGIEYTNTYSKPVKLEVAQIPVLTTTIEGVEDGVVMGKGVKKRIDITHKGIEHSINYNIFNGENIAKSDKIYIVDADNNKVNGLLDIEYLKNNKYYLCVDVTEEIGKVFTIKFWAEEYVSGMIERTEQNITIKVVEFEITDINLCNENNTITIKHGERKYLTSNISYRDVVVGDETEIAKFKKETLDAVFSSSNPEFGRKEIVQNMIIGNGITKHTEDSSSIYSVYNRLSQTLSYKTLENGNVKYEQLTIKDYENISVFVDSGIFQMDLNSHSSELGVLLFQKIQLLEC